MTSRETTGFLPESEDHLARPLREKALVCGWALIQWPWLLKSLSGGRRAEKRMLLERIGLPADSLPHLGSWKADTAFLKRIVDAIEEMRPEVVVELGCGASSLVIARALEKFGAGRLFSYDQHRAFVAATGNWLADHGLDAEMHHAPLIPVNGPWASCWYDLQHVPATIDLLIIDGPPWTLNPFVRGSAEQLFARLSPGARILLDDAARPGERKIARRWARDWPNIDFRRLPGGTKGTLEGRNRQSA